MSTPVRPVGSAEAVSSGPRVRATALRYGLIVLALACSDVEEGDIVSRETDNIDSVASLGDSLIARAGRLDVAVDSLQFALPGDTSGVADVQRGSAGEASAGVAGSGSAGGTLMPGDNAISRRARARGDSMARAAAMRLAGQSAEGGRAAGDTARGVVTLRGEAPAVQAVLRTSSGTMIALGGMVSTALSRMQGAEIVARGVRISPRNMVVRDFIVRGVNGVPAFDGRLESDGGGWSLALSDGSGRKRLTAVPSSMQSQAGARVWVSLRDGSATPASFGVIRR